MKALLFTAVALCAGAAAADTDRGRELVDGFVNDVSTISASFEQTLTGADGALLEVSTGTLEIERPGRFRWRYTEPYEQLLVADGRNVWSYDVDLEQVTVKPQDEALTATPALLLGGADNALDQFEIASSDTRDGLSWVRLTPESDDSGFEQLDLVFAGEMLERMVFLDNLGQTTVVELTDMVVNEPISPGTFEFEPPPGVDVVGTAKSADAADH